MKAEEENCIFPKSLLGTTMQDGGIRERRDGCQWFHLQYIMSAETKTIE